ncbi:hypothetical protein ABZ725_43315 [Streptomyces sp. NPDC006872]|uniref:hypothetical protein n=1 Tax=Streptomyces sp. NPDC006872 TaxID=3155720 RepID=UPI0033BFE2FC
MSAVAFSGLLAFPVFNPFAATSSASASQSISTAQPVVAPAYEQSTTCRPVQGDVLYGHACRGTFKVEAGMSLSVKLTGEVAIADVGLYEAGTGGALLAEAEYVGDEYEKLWLNDTGLSASVILKAQPFSAADTEKTIGVVARVEEPGDKLRHAAAFARLKAAGVKWNSSGNCTDRNNSRCTSYEGLRVASVNGAVALKQSLPEDCVLTVTAGTETGHSTSGTRTHRNGYKLDFSPTQCLRDWIRLNARLDTAREDRLRVYNGLLNGRSVEYHDETRDRDKPHWDITFH